MKITIIGAGIAGLTTAIALSQKGFEVEIFEQSERFKEAGSGINLAINAMQVFKKLGVYNDIIKNGNYINTMKLRKKDFSILSKAKFKIFESKYNVKSVAIHRAQLHKTLLNHLVYTKIHLNKKLESLSQKQGKVQFKFTDGTLHETDVLLGADGIHSNVRKAIFKDTNLRDAKQLCWRGISNAKIDKAYLEELNEVWGKGNRMGFVHINSNEIYWFALIRKNRNEGIDFDVEKEFSDFHPTIKQILNQTPKDKIVFNEIWDLKKIEKWYKGNVCLVGDSAHATTPNLGQGACQAIESAMAISVCLKNEKNVQKAFQKFQDMRKTKADNVVNTSWSVGKIAQTENYILKEMRNFIMPLIPNSISEKESAKLFDISYIK